MVHEVAHSYRFLGPVEVEGEKELSVVDGKGRMAGHDGQPDGRREGGRGNAEGR